MVRAPGWFPPFWRWAENASTAFFVAQVLILGIAALGAAFAVLADYWWLAPEALVGTWLLGEIALGATYKRRSERAERPASDPVAIATTPAPWSVEARSAEIARRPRRATPEYQMHALTQVLAELSKHGIRSVTVKEFAEGLASTERDGTDQRFEPLTWDSVTLGVRGLEEKGVLHRFDNDLGEPIWEWKL